MYAEVRKHFVAVEGAKVSEGRGAQGIRFGKKMHVMFTGGGILVKLPPARVAEIIASGVGLPHDPGTGSPMKDRVLITAANSDAWIAYCEEAREYAELE